MASRLQTKPEISCKNRCQIEGLDDTVATIYNTSLLVKKSGTSVDVKVDVKNVTEGRGTGEGRGGERRGGGTEGRGGKEGTRLGFLLGL